MASKKCFFISFLCLLLSYVNCDILCESGFCRTYGFETGCQPTHQHCRINNATHNGMWLPSPTVCNCCDYCLPFYGENEHCSVGGSGTGTTVGRCKDGFTCAADDASGETICQRMESDCHSAQDDYDARHEQGEVGALEFRPHCDGKAKYAAFDCVPTQTCFCQSEKGKRIFGEVLFQGTRTLQNMHCGCSRLHEKIRENISPSIPYPVVGPRCTADGNFNPIQCIHRTCYCVDRVTGKRHGEESIDLDQRPLRELSCYDEEHDLFPIQSTGEPPYNYTTPCLENMRQQIEFKQQSEKDGFNVDFFSEISSCLPDGTFGRVAVRGGRKICVDDRSQQINDYVALPNSPEYDNMDCKCAQTSLLMTSSTERPVCCKNGNFRKIQCRRGLCRCVDSDGRQVGRESADVTQLACFTSDWRDC